MKWTFTKVLLASGIVLLAAAPLVGSASDVDELTNLLDELLNEDAPVADAWDVPTTQSAADIQAELNGENDNKEATDDGWEKSANQMILDDEVGEDHNSAQDILDEDEKWVYAWEKKSKTTITDITENQAMFTTNKVLYDGNEITDYRIRTKSDAPTPAPEEEKVEVEEPEETNDDEKEEIAKNDEQDEVIDTEVEEVVEEPEVQVTYIKNVTNTVKDNEVTLKWNAAEKDAQNVEVILRHTKEDAYTTIGTPVYKDGTFTFKVTEIGAYFLKLQALDKDGKAIWEEDTSTIRVAKITEPTQKDEEVVANAPKVGPTTDLLLGLLIFSMIMYMVMRFRRIR